MAEHQKRFERKRRESVREATSIETNGKIEPEPVKIGFTSEDSLPDICGKNESLSNDG